MRRIRLTEGDLRRIVKSSVRKFLRESMEGRVFPKDFTEYDSNSIDFDDHSVEYSVEEDDWGWDEGQRWTWHIQVTANGGKRATDQVVQRSEDSAKWTFYEAYEKLCKWVGVQPAAMP